MMDNNEIEIELKKIKAMHPYWQKWEWLKIKIDEPELYKILKDKLDDQNDCAR